MGATVADPKGVMITHKMMLTNVAGIQKRLGDKKLTQDDSYLSHLQMGDALE